MLQALQLFSRSAYMTLAYLSSVGCCYSTGAQQRCLVDRCRKSSGEESTMFEVSCIRE